MKNRAHRSARGAAAPRGGFGRAPAVALALALAPAGCSVISPAESIRKDLTLIRSNPNPGERYEAYTDLGNPSLYRADPTTRAQAVRILGLALRSEEDPITRAAIARSLARLGGPGAHTVLIGTIGDHSAMVRTEVCSGLGSIGSAADVPTLVDRLQTDPDFNVRLAAAEALGHFSDRRGADALVENMSHRDPAMRYEALRALRRLTGSDQGTDPAAWRKYLPTAHLDGSVQAEKLLGLF